MDIQQGADGHKRFVLGPVELWIVAVLASALVGIVGWLAISSLARLDRVEAALITSNTDLKVISAQLTTLQTQLADVPGLQSRVAKLETTAETNTDRIRALEMRVAR